MTKRTNKAKAIEPKACSDECARNYREHKTAILALLERLDTASKTDFDRTFANVKGEVVHFGHTGNLGRIQVLLSELSDLVFSEGEYAQPSRPNSTRVGR